MHDGWLGEASVVCSCFISTHKQRQGSFSFRVVKSPVVPQPPQQPRVLWVLIDFKDDSLLETANYSSSNEAIFWDLAP
jgi:hypothetical protein